MTVVFETNFLYIQIEKALRTLQLVEYAIKYVHGPLLNFMALALKDFKLEWHVWMNSKALTGWQGPV